MSCFLASLLSTTIGIALFEAAGGRQRIQAFLLCLGTSVYAVNKYGLADEQRIALSQKLSLRLVGQLALLVLVLAFVIAPACLPFYLTPLAGYSTWEIIGYGGAGLLLPAWIYLRKQREAEHLEYPPSKQLFYYLTLGVPAVGKALSGLESLCFRRADGVRQAIVITGLARAGTTILLQYLHQHSRLQSITYRTMPLLLSPRLWRLANRASSRKVERTHRDGIQVDLDSPEAFDEYYWRVVLKDKFCRADALVAHEVDESQIRRYERYVAANLRPNVVYLSKNNNFLLRAVSFLALRENYTVVIVYRHPVDHAHSLLRQHRIQTDDQQRTPFVLDYMDMLGHHEFGQHRLDFKFENSRFQFEDKTRLDYWLERWVDYYRRALQLQGENIAFVGNETIAADPNRVVGAILERFGLCPENEIVPRGNAEPRWKESDEWDLASDWLETAQTIYSELQVREVRTRHDGGDEVLVRQSETGPARSKLDSSD